MQYLRADSLVGSFRRPRIFRRAWSRKSRSPSVAAVPPDSLTRASDERQASCGRRATITGRQYLSAQPGRATRAPRRSSGTDSDKAPHIHSSGSAGVVYCGLGGNSHNGI